MSHAETVPQAQRPYAMRKLPKQRRAALTVDAILEAAARILVEAGYATASTNRIAERAGVGIGSLYEYFPGKEAIFAELRRREMSKWYARLRAGPRSGSPREVIRHIVTTQVRYAGENPRLYAALETEVPRAAVADAQGAIQDDFLTLSSAYLESNRDLLRPKAPIPFVAEFLARWVSTTVHGFAMHSPRELDGEHLVNELVDAVARYLLRDGADPDASAQTGSHGRKQIRANQGNNSAGPA